MPWREKLSRGTFWLLLTFNHNNTLPSIHTTSGSDKHWQRSLSHGLHTLNFYTDMAGLESKSKQVTGAQLENTWSEKYSRDAKFYPRLRLQFIEIIWKALQHCSWTRDPSHYLTCSKTTKHPVNRRHLTFRWRRCSWSTSGGCPPRWWTASSRRRTRWVRAAGAAAGCWSAWARCSTAGCSRSRGCRSTRGPRSPATRLQIVKI